MEQGEWPKPKRWRDGSHKEETFQIWNLLHNYDRVISDYVEEFTQVPTPPYNVSGKMLRLTRQALYLTIADVAKKLGVTQSTLTRIEKSECGGNIKIKTLAKVARALDCELVYCLRPKSREPFSRQIWDLVYPILNANPRMKVPSVSRNKFAITARRLMEHPQFQKKMKWNQRDTVSEGGTFRMFINKTIQSLFRFRENDST